MRHNFVFKALLGISAILLASTQAQAVGIAPRTLECSLKSMSPTGQSQPMETKQIPISGSGTEIDLAHGNYSASAYTDGNSNSDAFVIDLKDNSSGRESGLKTTVAALSNTKINANLRITDAGDWVFLECSISN
ncbi:MAG: hypothetical protein P4M08_06500 [Oligoflexia bacterium]|nr:hypothetical protein [Oligoflexia bacterium]